MKLKTFKRLIKLSQSLNKKQSLINKECKELFGEDSQFLPYDKTIDEITKILMAEFNDKAGWIDWWIYENNYGEKGLKAYYKDRKVIPFKTASDLYKFLTDNNISSS